MASNEQLFIFNSTEPTVDCVNKYKQIFVYIYGEIFKNALPKYEFFSEYVDKATEMLIDKEITLNPQFVDKLYNGGKYNINVDTFNMIYNQLQYIYKYKGTTYKYESAPKTNIDLNI